MPSSPLTASLIHGVDYLPARAVRTRAPVERRARSCEITPSTCAARAAIEDRRDACPEEPLGGRGAEDHQLIVIEGLHVVEHAAAGTRN